MMLALQLDDTIALGGDMHELARDLPYIASHTTTYTRTFPSFLPAKETGWTTDALYSSVVARLRFA
jgi:hypothetical protein